VQALFGVVTIEPDAFAFFEFLLAIIANIDIPNFMDNAAHDV